MANSEYEEAEFFLCNPQVTIAELRRLNKETLMDFPLPMLNAVMDCGVDVCCKERMNAVVKQRIYERERDGENFIGVDFLVLQDSKIIGVIEPVDIPDRGFRCVKRLRVSDFDAISNGETDAAISD